MTSLTPIRIRGKRGVKKTKKEDVAKGHQYFRSKSATPSNQSSSARSTPSTADFKPRRRRKRPDMELSRLEQLPTEMLQTIFEFSANLNLPLVSSRLASQLSSRHLHHSLSSIVLEPVLGGGSSDAALAAAKRLMNSHFFTWPFLQAWLRDEFQARGLKDQCREAFGSDINTVSIDRIDEWTWYTLRPDARLAPPIKLLHGPFTDDKIRFLRFLAASFRDDPEILDPAYLEKAKEGLQQAVSEGAKDSLQCFWTLGLEPDTELLRLAVIDAGCDKELVRSLVTRVLHLALDPIDVDFLDPTLWSWAEKVQARGDGKGPWLKDLLKDAARESGRKDTEIKHARSILYE